MTSEAVQIEVHGSVVRVWLNRPRVKNAIDDEVIDGLDRAIDVAEDAGAAVVVIRGRGGTFCTGADLDHVRRHLVHSAGALERYVTRLSDVLDRLQAMSAAVVSLVEGYALAGGCELLLACDLAVATQDARIGDRHLEYGLLPGAGGAVRLSRALPPCRARYLLMTGEMLSGTEAAQWGLVTIAVPSAELEQTAQRLIDRLTSRSPAALAAVKQMAVDTPVLSLNDALRYERQVFIDHITTDVGARDGLQAFADGIRTDSANGRRFTRESAP